MWNSVEDIVSKLGLPAPPGDLEAVEKALKQQMTTVHPDVTSGDFASEGQRERFHNLRDAVEFVQRQRSGPLTLRATDLPAIIEAAALALRQAALEPKQTRSQVMMSVRQELRRSYKLPKITSAALFVVCAAGYTFIEKINMHPIFRTFLDVPGVLLFLGIVLAMSGISFIALWLREQVTDQEVQERLSEREVKQAFRGVCQNAAQNPERRFSRSDVVESQLHSTKLSPFWLIRHGHKAPLSYWLRWLRGLVLPAPKVDQHAAEQIASFYLTRWSERGAIKHSAYADSEEWFEVDATVLERHR
ncbi:hypothetical protein D4S03_12000 [bacterium]|nr:MAG: hypothetical protein D4S03_12000 [bacterium]